MKVTLIYKPEERELMMCVYHGDVCHELRSCGEVCA